MEKTHKGRPRVYEKKRRTKSIRMDDDLYQEIKRRAEERYVDASKYIVDAVLDRIRREMKYEVSSKDD